MTNTTDKPRLKALAPAIREVCLLGSPARRYIHITPKGLRTEDSGLRKTPKVGTG